VQTNTPCNTGIDPLAHSEMDGFRSTHLTPDLLQRACLMCCMHLQVRALRAQQHQVLVLCGRPAASASAADVHGEQQTVSCIVQAACA
jgi:hypothetical protein